MKTTGRVNGIISNIVIVKADGPVGQNEICHVYCGDTKMMAEVIKVVGDSAYVSKECLENFGPTSQNSIYINDAYSFQIRCTYSCTVSDS